MKGWRPLLRLAWRDVLRSRARSILVLILIALPVMAVTAADVVGSTADVAPHEAVDRKLGTADAIVYLKANGGPVIQTSPVSPDASWEDDPDREPATFDDVVKRLGAGTRGIELQEGSVRAGTDKGSTLVEVLATDLADPLLDGTFRLTDGRLPTTKGEVAVSPYLASRGPGLGEELEPVSGSPLKVVGIVEDAESRDMAQAWTLPGAVDFTPVAGRDSIWLVDAPGAVTWGDVLALNKVGALAISRAVVADPPAPEDIPNYDDMNYDQASNAAIFILIVMMALLEVVLLAGPAFAVRARNMQRQLAVVAANGGTPGQVRRAVLATGVVIGALGAALGVALGIPLAMALTPLLQRFSAGWFGPLDIPWLHLLGIAAFGFASAVIAAIVPAWLASRQDVVRVLAGRRGDRRPTALSPILGLILIGVGLWLTWQGTRGPVVGMGETWIGFGAVFAVVGTVLLVPVVVDLIGRVAGRAPLAVRYAVRDAARHRTRTAPAIGAALASVAGVVALGIANASDEAGNRENYVAELPMGTGLVTYWSDGKPADEAAEDWSRVTAATRENFPDAVELRGVTWHPGDEGSELHLVVRTPAGVDYLLDQMTSRYGSSHLVADRVPDVELGIPENQVDEADRMLATGGAVVLSSKPVDADTVTFAASTFDEQTGEERELRSVTVPATYVVVDGVARAEAVLAPAVTEQLGVVAKPLGLALGEQVSRDAERDLSEAIGAITESAGLYVERGYERPDEFVIMLLVLFGLGSVLMLGGTLTATFLALSDARPDLATLSAVGAAPRTRRLVAAAYAFVIGGIGAALGAVVGFVPGIAATWPLTANSWTTDGTSGHAIDIPWLLILGVVVGLPILTAAVVGLFARSRLPMVARID